MTHFKPTIDLGKYKKYTFTVKRGENIKKNIDFQNIPNLPGVYVRYNDDTPFKIACQYGHFELVKWLFNYKPDINITVPLSRICLFDKSIVIYFD